MDYNPKNIQSDTGFALGMHGEILGHLGEFVGFLRYRNQDESDPWVWEEWCFRSKETYYWLEYDPEAKTFGFHEAISGPQIPKPDGKTHNLEIPGLGKLSIDEQGEALLEEMYGQIPWSASLGESLHYVDGHIGKENYSLEWSDEVEYFKTKRVNKKDLRAGFGLSSNFFAKSLNKASDKRSRPVWRAVMIGFALTLILAGYAETGGKTIHSEKVSVCPNSDTPSTDWCVGTVLPLGPISLNNVGHVHMIEVRAANANEQNWHSLYLNLVDEQGNPVSGLSGDFWSEYWREGGESGVESNHQSKRLFKLEKQGTYYIDLEAELEKGANGPLDFWIYVYEDVLLARYFLILAGILGFLLVIKHRLYNILLEDD